VEKVRVPGLGSPRTLDRLLEIHVAVERGRTLEFNQKIHVAIRVSSSHATEPNKDRALA
jgi:hypothetical protein